MKFEIKDERLCDTGEKIKVFKLITRKGYACGFVHNNTLKIHHIGTNEGYSNPVKGIMNILCNKFKTNKFIFQMVINNNLKKCIKGKLVKIPPDAKGNPFGEWLEEIHGEWVVS